MVIKIKNLWQRFKESLIFLSLFSLTFFVYLKTLAPTIYLEDSAEFITAVATLGIPHPPGFPLYVILGKFFSFLPLGTIAWRVNLMSAFFASASIAFFYLIIKKVTANYYLAVTIPLILAFSQIFWSQSLVAEVYTLNLFLLTILILLLLSWQEKKEEKYLQWFALVYGLSLTNHTMMVLLAPIFYLYIVKSQKDIWWQLELWLKLFLLFLIGLSVYLYLPLISLQEPVLDWGDPENLKNFWQHVSRAQYHDFGLFRFPLEQLELAGEFIGQLVNQFSLWIVVFGLVGLLPLYLKNKKLFLLIFGILIINGPALIFLRSVKPAYDIAYLYRVYYLPAYLILLLSFAWTFNLFWQRLNKQSVKLKLVAKALFFGGLLIIPLILLVSNWQRNDLSNNYLAYDYGVSLLNSLEPNTILLIKHPRGLIQDSELFIVTYLKAVEKMRPDVTIFTHSTENFKKRIPCGYDFYQQREFLLISAVDSAIKLNYPLYADFIVDNVNDIGLVSRSNGIVYKVYRGWDEALADNLLAADISIPNLADKIYSNDNASRELIGHFYYSQSNFYLEQGYLAKATDYITKAIALDLVPFSEEYQFSQKHKIKWLSLKNN